MALPSYSTRERVKTALDWQETARNNGLIDDALAASSRSVEDQMSRARFYPQLVTLYYDWPNDQFAAPWRLWFDANDMLSIATLTSGGTVIPASAYNLEPNRYGPPYTHLELKLSASAAFGGGATPQRDITIVGVAGYNTDTVPAGALAEVLDTSETGVDVSDSAAVGVGDLILCESERMIVTGKVMRDTGVNIDAGDSLTASMADVGITASTLTGIPIVDETILIGSERMLVTDVAGTLVTVKRAVDGTVLATHAANSDIYAPRTLTVVRGALGTTAATHADTTALTRHDPPPLIRELTEAEAINRLLQKTSGYVRTIGSGETVRNASGAGLADVRDRCYAAHGRKMRHRAV